ncbi:hypothetical protein OAL67_00600 [bacterium]|nr:hypothetical protein [bacterium]
MRMRPKVALTPQDWAHELNNHLKVTTKVGNPIRLRLGDAETILKNVSWAQQTSECTWIYYKNGDTNNRPFV